MRLTTLGESVFNSQSPTDWFVHPRRMEERMTKLLQAIPLRSPQDFHPNNWRLQRETVRLDQSEDGCVVVWVAAVLVLVVVV